MHCGPVFCIDALCSGKCRQPDLVYKHTRAEIRQSAAAAAHRHSSARQLPLVRRKTQKSSAPRRIRAAAQGAAPKDIMGK